jgi:predicted DNA-binding ribbon-helix-helix protein
MSRIQRAVRFEDETWNDLRLAAKEIGVSATALIEAISAEWLAGIKNAEPWAIKVLSEARLRHRALQNGGNYKNMPKNASGAE